jgi:hypothetical protein
MFSVDKNTRLFTTLNLRQKSDEDILRHLAWGMQEAQWSNTVRLQRRPKEWLLEKPPDRRGRMRDVCFASGTWQVEKPGPR